MSDANLKADKRELLHDEEVQSDFTKASDFIKKNDMAIAGNF